MTQPPQHPGNQPGNPPGHQPGHQSGQPGQWQQPSPQQGWPQPPQQGWQQPAYGASPAPGQQAPGPGQYGPPHQGYAQAYGPPTGVPAGTKQPAGSAAKLIGWLLVLLAVVIVVGSIGPWVTSDLFDRAGLGGVTWHDKDLEKLVTEDPGSADGLITLIFAVVVAAAGLVRGLGRATLAMAITALVAALLITAIAAIDTADVTSTENALIGDINVGWGLWLVLLAGMAASVVALAGVVKRR